MNPLGVLTARDVMGPVVAADTDPVATETPVSELIELISGPVQAIPVAEGQDIIGTVTAGSIVARLQNN